MKQRRGEEEKKKRIHGRPMRISHVVMWGEGGREGGRLGSDMLADQHSPPVALPESCTS